MNALQQADAALHAARSANRVDAETAIAAARATGGVDLKLSLANSGIADMDAVRVRMFEDGVANGQQADVSIGSNRVVVVQGNRAAGAPFFVSVDLPGATPNELHGVNFLLETPGQENEAPEAQTFGGISYYVFDPDAPVCPAPLEVVKPGG